MANHYEIPSWAGKPPAGFHLDVLKIDKMVQKLMIDEKKCYLFGRNPQLNDFCIDHASCSRVHAALVFHKHLQRAFLVDLGSTHGTFIGSVRLEAHKPTQLPIDSQFHFGASTRLYIIRERPQSKMTKSGVEGSVLTGKEENDPALIGLPETEGELDNLTEFNTAHNRRITTLGMPEEDNNSSKKRKRYIKSVSINDDEEVINPEDVDPSIGRFRNLVQTTVVSAKKPQQISLLGTDHQNNAKLSAYNNHYSSSLYADLPEPAGLASTPTAAPTIGSFSNKLGMSLPNPAPDIDISHQDVTVELPPPPSTMLHLVANQDPIGPSEPKKKKYAKEAWPGKKPVPALLV